MADTRINALSTATVSLSDDFLPIDGTTAGTKKLSAYSPSFGGNATVGGTLTVNGTGTSTVSGPTNFGTASNQVYVSGDTGSNAYFQVYGTSSVSNLYMGSSAGTAIPSVFQVGGTNRFTIASTGATVSATTASTSTSSGALVVGNGTSGGLGVGGAIWGGGKVHVGSAGYADGGAKLNVYATPSDAGYLYGIRLSDNSTATLALGLQTPTGTTSSFIHSNIALGFGTVGTAALNINTSQQVQVLTTTASTSTSSGALVVSGGVGVAGAIVTGGIVRCGGSNGLSLGSDTGNIRIDSAGPAGVEFRGLSAADTITGFTMREMALIDGTTAPSTRAGYATIYVDTADGDLKVKFGDGTVKTIATDS
jgi:hypothetical protein